jgi:hypothetical protein
MSGEETLRRTVQLQLVELHERLHKGGMMIEDGHAAADTWQKENQIDQKVRGATCQPASQHDAFVNGV